MEGGGTDRRHSIAQESGEIRKEAVKLKAIKRRFYFYTGAFAALMITSLSIFTGGAQPGWPPLAFAISLSALAAGLALREHGRLKAAGMIIENQILHIRPAMIEESGRDAKAPSVESMEVFVSCFGILLDSRIIKFNQAGIRLLTVEIGQDSISIRYGTDKKQHMITLLCETLDEAELAEISRRFRYETGIMPTITH